jgi:chromosomal replication initiator protein
MTQTLPAETTCYQPWFSIIRLECPSIGDIQEAVAEFYGITRGEILSECRSRGLVLPRQIAMFLAQRFTHLPFLQIGKSFAWRDAATVIFAVRKIERLLQEDSELADEIAEIQRRLEAL